VTFLHRRTKTLVDDQANIVATNQNSPGVLLFSTFPDKS